ncbi:MAG: ABC transporter substrate-binding protein [Pseudomonadota bacterium]
MDESRSLTRRAVLGAGLSATLGVSVGAAAPPPPATAAGAPPKVLRYAFEIAETSLDPVKLQDLYSRTLTAHLFEGLYTYDHLARPVRIKPLTAAGMPEVSADFRVWTVKIQPGIFFLDDPVFGGKRRELVAQDYVYAIKRFADPANTAPSWADLESVGFVGLAAVRQQALDQKRRFDYDQEIEGLRALDRHTVRFTLATPRPRLIETLAQTDLLGAVAREVVEHYGDRIEEHPVGTGPFRLVQWRRSSFIAFERNPGYRERYYDAEPAAADAEGQALLARFKGRRLPMIDRVEISVIEQDQPRWLSFINGEADLIYRVGFEYVPQAMPGGKVAPNLAKQHIRGYPIIEPASNAYFFNMDDPVFGGYTPERVALRRAIAMGTDSRLIINYAYSGLGSVAQSPILPHTTGFDAALKTEFGDFDPARARALLDLYGYLDRDGDGWRETPGGAPLVLAISTQSDQRSRRIAEVLDRNLKVLGVRTRSLVAQWPENLKAARAGRLQFWFLGSYANGPDPEGSFARFDSRQIGGQNMSRTRLPALDALFDRSQVLPDGPERLATFAEMTRLVLAYMPEKFVINRQGLDMSYPQLLGYRRTVFSLNWWEYADIDNALRAASRAP